MHTYIHAGQTESSSSPEEDFSSPDAYDEVDKRHHAPRRRPRHLSLQNNYPHNERGSQSYHSSSYNTSQNTNAMSESNSHNNGSESQPLDNQLFKIFRTASNEEYTVYDREDGHMFYVDWEQQVIYIYSNTLEYTYNYTTDEDSCKTFALIQKQLLISEDK